MEDRVTAYARETFPLMGEEERKEAIIVFSERYEDAGYTQGDVDRLYSKIERDVSETVREEH